ncbi:type II toxin-antitoxin system VapB family antitoxin [Streptomyces sp. NPDC055078]
MSRVVVDLDAELITEALRLFGTTSADAAVRAAVDDAVKRRLRREFRDAIRSGELDVSEIVDSTGPRHRDGSLKRRAQGGRAEGAV